MTYRKLTSRIFVSATALLFPIFVSAQTAGSINTTYLSGYSNSIVSIINTILVPLLVALAFIVFIWGVFNYFIRGAAEPDKRTEGTQFILWGVIGFVVIFSVWGIVNIFSSTLGLGGSTVPAFPALGNSTSGSLGSTGSFFSTSPGGSSAISTGTYTSSGQPIYTGSVAPSGGVVVCGASYCSGSCSNGSCTVSSGAGSTGSGTTASPGSASCTGPGDISCGSGNICQQGTNGFYACFPATAGSGACTGPTDTSCGSGNSCQQNNNGFYACFPNMNSSAGSGSASAQSQSCTGPGDTSCGSGNVCQQSPSNGFYMCFPASTAPAAVSGCTNPAADNYNSNATVDDGSCTYSGD